MLQPGKKRAAIEHGQRITASEQIISLLKRLMEDGSRLSIHLPDDPRPYPSALIALNEQQGLLQLDELGDKVAHEKFSATEHIVIEGRLGGVLVRFSSNRSKKPGLDNYQLELPKHLIYRQHRDNRRTRISKLVISCSAILQRDYLPVKGILLDISANGMGIACKGLGRLRYNDSLNKCSFELPDVGRIQCRLKIRYLQEIAAKNLTRIGCQFVELPLADQELIDRQLLMLKTGS